MTTLERSVNGRDPSTDLPQKQLDNDGPEGSGSSIEDAVPESGAVTEFRQRLVNRTIERDIAQQFSEVDTDPVFEDVRSPQEQTADRKVAEKVRAKQRTETQRAGQAKVRDARRARIQQQWQNRAERARERVTNPDRALATDHRRWLFTSMALFALLTGGVAFMSDTVKQGLFGAAGSWIGYVVEPLASVLLIVSLLAQYTARQRELPVPRGLVVFDFALATASVALNTIPWGLRYGWDAGSLTAHLLVPLLVVAAVTAWHIASRIYGDALAASRQQNGQHADRLALLREAVRVGELPTDVSPNQVIKYLRANLPTGIGHQSARQLARDFLGY